MPFSTEALLFQQVFESSFIKNFVETLVYPTIAYIEPKGFFGIPDLVIANLSNIPFSYQVVRTFAFEMKLSNWQRALIQAYKYRAFVNFSYVVLDRSNIKPALNHIEKFIMSNIGLISVDNTGFVIIHHFPKHDDPYSPPLQQKLETMILKEDYLFHGKEYPKPIRGLNSNDSLIATPILM